MVDISLFMLMAVIIDIHWFVSATISFVLATLVNYFLSIRHVFESGVRFARHHEISLVFMVSAVGLVINQLVLWLSIEQFSIDLLVSKLFATGIVFFWNYGARSKYIFEPVGISGRE